MRIISTTEFNWKRVNNEFVLFHGCRKLPFSVIPDVKYLKMGRIQFADGSLSDMVNLTRAKDGAALQAVSILNNTAKAAML